MAGWWRRRTLDPSPDPAAGGSPPTGGEDAAPDLPATPPGGRVVRAISERDFMEATGEHGRLTVVDFWAPWCPPCRPFSEVFEEVARRYGDRLAFASCNLEHSPSLPQLLQFSAVPTVILFDRAGNEVERFSGAHRRQLERMVARAAGRDGG